MKSQAINALVLLAISQVAACSIPVLDRGLIHRNGITQTPSALPVAVRCEIENCEEIQEAIDWWHEQVGRSDLFVLSEHEGVPVRGDDLPAGVDGWVVTTRDAETRDVITMEMILQEDEITLSLVRHELGHLLRLADDIYSVSDRSIMSTPHGRWSRVTDQDREILRGMQ